MAKNKKPKKRVDFKKVIVSPITLRPVEDKSLPKISKKVELYAALFGKTKGTSWAKLECPSTADRLGYRWKLDSFMERLKFSWDILWNKEINVTIERSTGQ